MQCIFCRQYGTLTKEHVLPDWLADVIWGRHSIVTNEFIGTTTLKWQSKVFQHKLKSVCKSCNNGWMANLEGEMKPIFAKMIALEKITLAEETQNIIAFWAQKTTLMLNQSIPGGVKVTSELFDEIYANKTFSKRVLVKVGWRMKFGGSKANPIASFTIRQIPSVDLPKDAANDVQDMINHGGLIWRATLAVGPIVFDLAGHNMKLKLEVASNTKVLQTIRPYNVDMIWPLDWPIEAEGGLDTLSNAL